MLYLIIFILIVYGWVFVWLWVSGLCVNMSDIGRDLSELAISSDHIIITGEKLIFLTGDVKCELGSAFISCLFFTKAAC